MVTLLAILTRLEKGDSFVVEDLNDIYFNVSIWLTIAVSFSLLIILGYKKWAIWVGDESIFINRHMAPVVAYLRTKGVTVFLYVDNCLIVVKIRQ